MTPHEAPGWHGKLPSLGDFASRRLDPEFLGPWDEWLARGMLSLRDRPDGQWLDAYLSSPSWRFLLMPGALDGQAGQQAWAGILMPSVDRVGRYFPFTIAQPLGDALNSTLQMPMLWQWLASLDDLAAEALQEDWGVDRLEEELGQVPVSIWHRHLASTSPGERNVEPGLHTVDLDSGTGPQDWIGMQAHDSWRRREQGQVFWYADAGQAPPRLLCSEGLPPASEFNRLMGGVAP